MTDAQLVKHYRHELRKHATAALNACSRLHFRRKRAPVELLKLIREAEDALQSAYLTVGHIDAIEYHISNSCFTTSGVRK